jgi:CelD/BcsL family acetyltransferase involved in cellulose biosynthesis
VIKSLVTTVAYLGQSMKSVHFDVLADAEELLALKPEWENLCDRSKNYFYSQTFQWCWTAWRLIGRPKRHRLYCLVGRVDERVVLIWPFEGFRRGIWAMLRPLGSETTEYTEVLVEDSPDAHLWVSLAWEKLRRTCDSDIINLPYVRNGSLLHHIVSEERPISAWSAKVSSVAWDAYDGWEAYYGSRKRGFRYSLRSNRRRLAQHGAATFEVITEGEEFRSTLDWLFSRKTQWLNDAKQDAPWRDTDLYKCFLLEVAAKNELRTGLILFVLSPQHCVGYRSSP